MNEKELIEELLCLTKNSCDIFLHGTIESNSANVHATFQNALNESLDIQNSLFSTMENKGWYKTTAVEEKKVTQALSKFI